MVEFWLLGIVLFSTIIASYGALYLKLGAKDFKLDIKALILNWRLMLGAFLYAISAAILVIALKYEDLSIIYPLTSSGYVWISLLSIKYLGEKMNILKWSGIMFIILGVILMT